VKFCRQSLTPFLVMSVVDTQTRIYNTHSALYRAAPGIMRGHSKIARVRAYYLYCMCLAVLTSLQILTVTKI